MPDLVQHVMTAGFPFPNRLIHLFVGGSELHGAKVHGTDDIDIYGISVEPPKLVLGLEYRPHFVWATVGAERRIEPNDVEVLPYPLKKRAMLD